MTGYRARRAAMERWKEVFGMMRGSGYSQARAKRPARRLSVCRTGTGLTEELSDLRGCNVSGEVELGEDWEGQTQ